MGIRADYDGLRLAPVIPPEWDGFRAVRVFRRVTYHLTVRRVGSGSEAALTVDGQPVEGNLVIPAFGKASVEVQVVLR